LELAKEHLRTIWTPGKPAQPDFEQATPTKPKEIPDPFSRARSRVVYPLGEVNIPRYVVRVHHRDQERGGWQVRFDKPFTYFKDRADIPLSEAVQESFEQAKKYLRETWRPVLVDVNTTYIGKDETDTPGVCLTEKPATKRKRRSWGILVKHPGSKRTKYFHIGSEKTYTPERHKEAVRLAIEQRKEWLKEYTPQYR